MMAMYNKLQYEDEQRRQARERAKLQADTRARFQENMDELKRRDDAERQEMLEYHQQQQKELDWWKEEEKKKELAIKQKHHHEKEVRLQQIRDKQARAAKEAEKKKHRETAEIKRCVDALRKEEELAVASKQRERAYLREVLVENEKTRKARESLWKNEADEDVRLMKEYAARLDAQDAARAKAFEDKIRTSASNEEMTHKLKAAERERERQMDINIARYTKEREDREDARGLREIEKRTMDRVNMRRTLDEQIALQETIKKKESAEEKKYAALYRKDGEQARADETVLKQKAFQKKLETRKLFLDQIEDKKRRGITSESLENMGMSESETLMNKQMMQTIKNTPGMMERIQATLRGGSGAAADAAEISNVF